MVIDTIITRGRLVKCTKKRKVVEQFFPDDRGGDCEVYIKFDNGSVIGHTQFNGVQAYIKDAIKEFEEIPTSEQW